MKPNPREVRMAAITLTVAAVVLWIPLIHLLLGRDSGFLADLGFRSGPPGTAVAWVLGVVVAVLYAGYAIRNNPLVREHWLRFSGLKLLGIVAAVGAAVVEEAFFRRILMDWVLAQGGPALVQIMVSGMIFGLAHGVWGIVTRRVWVGLKVMFATGTVGVALAVVYVVGGRSLAPVIASHFLITASIQPGIMIAAFSGQLGPRAAVA